MKISSIKQQIKNPDRASIFVDGKYSFSLHLNELVQEKLRIGQDIDEAALKRLTKMSEDGKLRSRVLEWVLNRPRSLREVRDYLYRKKADNEFSERVVSEFIERGYVSDEKFSLWLIDVRKRGGKSDRAIKNELMKKGVSREVISEVMQGDQESERARLRALYDKKSGLARYKNDPQKFKQYLLRQGFSYDDINELFLNG